MLRTLVCQEIRANTERLLTRHLTVDEREAILTENNRLRAIRATLSPRLDVPATPHETA